MKHLWIWVMLAAVIAFFWFKSKKITTNTGVQYQNGGANAGLMRQLGRTNFGTWIDTPNAKNASGIKYAQINDPRQKAIIGN